MARRRKSAHENLVSTEEWDADVSMHAQHGQTTNENAETEGLKLSPTKQVPINELTPSPHNSVFDDVKDTEYWTNLEQGIRDAGAIIETLVATKDNVLMSGHSRLQIAQKLFEEGDERFERVPVRYIQNDIPDWKIKEHVYLCNLNRFEIDPDTRIRLRAELYPGYYNDTERKPGRKREYCGLDDTANPDPTPSAMKIAEQNKTSQRKIQREKDLHLKASEIAHKEGRKKPIKDDYKKARARINADRKKQSNRTPSYSKNRIFEAMVANEEDCADKRIEGSVREFVEFPVGERPPAPSGKD
jgi:hypothetical protein